MVLAQTIGLEAWYLKLQGKPENSKQSESKYFFEKQRPLKRFLYRQRVFLQYSIHVTLYQSRDKLKTVKVLNET